MMMKHHSLVIVIIVSLCQTTGHHHYQGQPKLNTLFTRYLSHRNKQLQVDTNTDNTEQHSKSKGGTTKILQVQLKLMQSSMQCITATALCREEKQRSIVSRHKIQRTAKEAAKEAGN